eukprot:gnl/Dysnectes_brevis/890_a985_2844.p1 GENE.gnl/Dysnectes_brevis/890_a985_2844~~gnl/Dysnectes_brevis/890_a985_2844.p1  ORF type:complete len:305 (+),score=42.42 gnl/Dysnectes_brevis/890_a985_2844:65-979(+)
MSKKEEATRREMTERERQLPPRNGIHSKLQTHIDDLRIPEKRASALKALCYTAEQINPPDLGEKLWSSVGIPMILLQEILAVYSMLDMPEISQSVIDRICSSLFLVSLMASHPNTRIPFIESQFALYLYPLVTPSTLNSTKEIAISALCVFFSMAKTDDRRILSYLVRAELVPILFPHIEAHMGLSRQLALLLLHRLVEEEDSADHPSYFEEPQRRKATLECAGQVLAVISASHSPEEYPHMSEGTSKCAVRALDILKLLSRERDSISAHVLKEVSVLPLIRHFPPSMKQKWDAIQVAALGISQ